MEQVDVASLCLIISLTTVLDPLYWKEGRRRRMKEPLLEASNEHWSLLLSHMYIHHMIHQARLPLHHKASIAKLQL